MTNQQESFKERLGKGEGRIRGGNKRKTASVEKERIESRGRKAVFGICQREVTGLCIFLYCLSMFFAYNLLDSLAVSRETWKNTTTFYSECG